MHDRVQQEVKGILKIVQSPLLLIKKEMTLLLNGL